MTDLIPTNQNPLILSDGEWKSNFAKWLSDFQPNTRKAYTQIWRDFLIHADLQHPGQVTQDDAYRYREHLRSLYSASTTLQKLSGLSSYYSWVIRNGVRIDNPFRGITRGVRVNKYGSAVALIGDQDVKLLQSIEKDSFVGVRDYAIILTYLTTGLRAKAVADATYGDLRRQGDYAFLHFTNKGGEADRMPLPGVTWKAIQGYLALRGSVVDTDALWIREWWNNSGKWVPMGYDAIYRMVIERCDAAFGPNHGITIHSLRHTFAVNAAKADTDIFSISKALRHKSRDVTLIYLDAMQGDGDAVPDVVAKRYG